VFVVSKHGRYHRHVFFSYSVFDWGPLSCSNVPLVVACWRWGYSCRSLLRPTLNSQRYHFVVQIPFEIFTVADKTMFGKLCQYWVSHGQFHNNHCGEDIHAVLVFRTKHKCHRHQYPYMTKNPEHICCALAAPLECNLSSYRCKHHQLGNVRRPQHVPTSPRRISPKNPSNVLARRYVKEFQTIWRGVRDNCEQLSQRKHGDKQQLSRQGTCCMDGFF